MIYKIKPSKTISYVIILSHVVSLLILLPLSLPPWSYFLIGCLLLVSALLALQTTGGIYIAWLDFAGRFVSILQFRWDSQSLWRIWTVDGQEYEVTLQPGSAVYRHLLILNFKTVTGSPLRRRFSLLLTEKQLATHEFRRIRVRLGLEGNQTSGDSVG